MIMKVITKIKSITIIGVLLIMYSCSLAPGMHFNQSSVGGEKFVYIESLDEKIKIENIADIKNIKESYWNDMGIEVLYKRNTK